MTTTTTDADPVGVADIAKRLGVRPNTVAVWLHRHPDFPAPRWKVSTFPAWQWPEVYAWALDSGRVKVQDSTT